MGRTASSSSIAHRVGNLANAGQMAWIGGDLPPNSAVHPRMAVVALAALVGRADLDEARVDQGSAST